MARRKLTISLALVALAVGALIVTKAANIHPPHIGSECEGGGEGSWHFVNNQTGGAGPGTLTATFADDGTFVVGPSQVNNNNQHFDIVGPSGPLTAASTDLPGRLVLSHLDCGPPVCEPRPEICDNGTDEDCDELIDCEDPDCAGDPSCDQCIPELEVCDNGADDDCDELVDCDDPDCFDDPACDECTPDPERCSNGIDDDCDGLIDCDDPDCKDSCGGCVPVIEQCGNGTDDDCDGIVDCDDPDCQYSPSCQ